jgi:hypothetical protein
MGSEAMAVIESPETVGLRPVHDFDDAWSTWPRGDRLDALRTAAYEFRGRFRSGPQVTGVRTFELAAVPYPAKFAFGMAARSINPYITLRNRMVLVQYRDFEGHSRTLVWEPTIPEGSAEAPFYAQLNEFAGGLAERFFVRYETTIDDALAAVGLRRDHVDFASFDHLHVQDARRVLGTTEPVDGQTEPFPPLFPNGKLISQRLEADTFKSTHPMQWAWYVQGGLDSTIEENHLLIEGDVELGEGVAIVRTPGHTDGNQSLVLNTPEGIWVSSENGVCADNWQPEQSRIPGMKRYAKFFGREVILNSNTLEDSIDQYDSMVLEKTLADTSRRDPRWLNIFPSSEAATHKRQWPAIPTFTHEELRYGEIAKRHGA